MSIFGSVNIHFPNWKPKGSKQLHGPWYGFCLPKIHGNLRDAFVEGDHQIHGVSKALQFHDRIQRIVMVNVGESTSPMGSYGIDDVAWGSQCLVVGTVGNQVMAEPVSVMNTLPLGRVGCLSTQQLCPMVHGKAGKSLFFVDSWNLSWTFTYQKSPDGNTGPLFKATTVILATSVKSTER